MQSNIDWLTSTYHDNIKKDLIFCKKCLAIEIENQRRMEERISILEELLQVTKTRGREITAYDRAHKDLEVKE